jgi:hypothetical protein
MVAVVGVVVVISADERKFNGTTGIRPGGHRVVVWRSASAKVPHETP